MRGYANLGSKIIQIEKDGQTVAIVRKVHLHHRTHHLIARWDKTWHFIEQGSDGAFRKVLSPQQVDM